MKKGFTFILLFLLIDCTAQIILNKPIDITVADINFNADVIKNNKIKRIDVIISDKPDGSTIVNKGAGLVYKFNENGYITRYMYTILNTNKSTVPIYIYDTINEYIFYNSKNQIISKRVKIGESFSSYYYEYDEQWQVRKQYHCKETNISGNKFEFKLGEQKLMSSDIFEYSKLTNTQTKKKTLNDNLNVYKKAIINYDDKKNKIAENSEFIVSCVRQERTYEYNVTNQLIKQTYTSNENGEIKTASIFEYEKNGNLRSEKKHKNGILVFEIQYIYDGNGTLIISEVNRDYVNATVFIKKYFYYY